MILARYNNLNKIFLKFLLTNNILTALSNMLLIKICLFLPRNRVL